MYRVNPVKDRAVLAPKDSWLPFLAKNVLSEHGETHASNLWFSNTVDSN